MSRSLEAVGRTHTHPIVAWWAQYNLWLERRPLSTKSITNGLIKFIATLISQKIRGVSSIDWHQIKQYVTFALFLDVPVNGLWYERGLPRLSRAAGLSTLEKSLPLLARLLKASLDQLTWGVFFNSYFFVATGITGGLSFRQSWSNMLQSILPTTRDSICFWVPATYAVLSLNNAVQIPAFSVFGLLWGIWLAYQEKKRKEACHRGIRDGICIESQVPNGP